jgi:hypothetical protein
MFIDRNEYAMQFKDPKEEYLTISEELRLASTQISYILLRD